MRMWISLAPVLLALGFALIGCTDTRTRELGVYTYPDDYSGPGCESDTRSGSAGAIDGERTAKALRFNVRTPANYDPEVAHPILVVYAPAGLSATASERLTGLTKSATTAGFVIAYADHVRNSIPTLEELSTIPALIAKKWCIDAKRIFLTGHSDGGTVALAIALLDHTKYIPAAIAPSAAGFTRIDLNGFKCRTPLPVMIMHTSKDKLFPNFGAEAAAWWAKCNQCERFPGMRMADGCVDYANCAGGVTTRYCEGSGPHAAWPALNQSLIDFFIAMGRLGVESVEEPVGE